MKHKSLKWQRPMGLWEVECLSAGKIMEISVQSPLDFNEVDKLMGAIYKLICIDFVNSDMFNNMYR